MVYVQPTATMNIKAGPHVEANGTVQIPYLREWRQVSLLLRIPLVLITMSGCEDANI